MRRWTAGEDELLRELVADGYRLEDVGAEVGRTYHSVTQRVCRLGLRSRAVHPPDPDVRARALSLLAAGVDRSHELATRLGWRKNSAWRFLCRLERDGLVRRVGHNRLTRWRVTKLWTDDDDARKAEARALARDGLSASEIARRLGRSKDGVLEWLRGEMG